MNKEQWQKLYNILYQIHFDFSMSYSDYLNGKNKNIRTEAERKVNNAIQLADYHIIKNKEVFNLLTGGNQTSDFGRTISYDEFLLPRYFGKDMSEFLDKIQNKINNDL